MSLNDKLFEAARSNDGRGVSALLDQGASTKSRGVSDLTPLHICGVPDAHHAAAELLSRGADTETTDQRGRSALHVAALSQAYKVMRLLIAHNANIHATDEEGKTPLATLSWNGGEEGVRMLLEAGADPNAVDNTGRSPLMLAMKSGHRNMAVLALLIRAGADPRVKDSEGVSAMSLAEFTQNHEAQGLFYGSPLVSGKAPIQTPMARPPRRGAGYRPEKLSEAFGKEKSNEKELNKKPFETSKVIISGDEVAAFEMRDRMERQRAQKAASAAGAPLNVKRRAIPF